MPRPQPVTCPGIAHRVDEWAAHADAVRVAVALTAAATEDLRGTRAPTIAHLTGVRAVAKQLVPSGLCRTCALDLIVHLAGSAAAAIPAVRRGTVAAQMRRHQLALGRD